MRAVAGEAGLGRHSILRQGAVDSIVAGGAAACRTALEEAAGLGVFRRRRIAASRKLEQAAARLESSCHLEAELSAQLRRIEAEARSACEYRDLEASYRKFSLAHLYRIAAREPDDGHERLARLDAEANTLQERQGTLQEEVLLLGAKERELGERVSAAENILQGLEQGRDSLRDEALRAERGLLGMEGGRGGAVDRSQLISRLEADLDKVSLQVQRLEGEVGELEEEHARKKDELGCQEELAARKRVEHVAAAERRVRLAGEMEALNHRQGSLADQLGAAGVRDADSKRLVEAGENLNAFAPGELHERIRAVLGRLERLRSLFEERATEAEQRRGVIASLVGRAEAEVEALRPVEKTAAGGKRLYEILRPRRGYETALEAALGELAGGVLAKTLQEGLELLSGASAERLVVRLDADEVPKNGRPPGTPL
ncbi:MAG TPA: hypothetical protein VE225_00625, partial [Rubrobacteraceae bacterium]|nr:hypothetical protein [Rubrobacteraceae bacterium]